MQLRHRELLITLLFALSIRAVVFAQADTDQQSMVSRWAQSEMDRTQREADARLCRLSWTVERHFPVSDTELGAARKAVAENPRHPDSVKLQFWLAYKQKGPERRRVTVWSDGEGRWRRCCDWLADLANMPPGFFHDQALGRDVYWQLNPTEMVVCVPNAPPDRVNISSLESSIRLESRTLRFGPFTIARSYDMVLQSAGLEGERWTAVWKNAGITLTMSGTWDRERRFGVAESAELSATAEYQASLSPQTKYRYYGWIADEPGLPSRYSRVESFDQAGSLHVLYSLVDAESITDAELDALVAPPALNQRDPIRGEPTVKWMYDYRPGVDKVTTRSSAGVDTASLGIPGASSPRDYLRWAGWVVGTGLLAVYAVLRWRRTRQSLSE